MSRLSIILALIVALFISQKETEWFQIVHSSKYNFNFFRAFKLGQCN